MGIDLKTPAIKFGWYFRHKLEKATKPEDIAYYKGQLKKLKRLHDI